MAVASQADKGSIFVTGGTGVVGKRIVSRLRQLGYCVRVLSRKYGYSEESGGIEFICGDIADGKLVEEAVAGCDAVFHCAAEIKDVDRMHEVNIVGTRNVFEAALKNNVRYFCHLSSVGVIGKTNRKIVDEHTLCSPVNLYERTKLQAERIVEQGIEGCRCIILRPTNVFAEETIELARYGGLGGFVRAWLTGKERSHLVYVEDVAEAAVYLLMNCVSEGCEKFIVSSDEELGGTNGDVYDAVRRLFGHEGTERRYTCPVGLTRYLRLLRHGYANRGDVCYSAQRLFSTGFKVPFGWFEGIKRCVEFNQRRAQVTS